MSRFFFNYHEHDKSFADDIGIEFETFELAFLDAFEATREMWPELMARRVDPRKCAFEIMDSQENPLALLGFSEVLESCSTRKTPPPVKMATLVSEARDTRSHVRCVLSEFRKEIDQTLAQLAAAQQLLSRLDEINKAGSHP